MPIVTLVAGSLLELIGFGGFFLSGMQSFTALIPAVFGTLLVVLGALALVKPGARKHFMHAAAALALLCFLGSARGLLQLPALLAGGEVARPLAVGAQSASAVVALVFVALCVKSFIDARRKKAAAPGVLG